MSIYTLASDLVQGSKKVWLKTQVMWGGGVIS